VRFEVTPVFGRLARRPIAVCPLHLFGEPGILAPPFTVLSRKTL
jgi:hypothetical protein